MNSLWRFSIFERWLYPINKIIIDSRDYFNISDDIKSDNISIEFKYDWSRISNSDNLLALSAFLKIAGDSFHHVQRISSPLSRCDSLKVFNNIL